MRALLLAIGAAAALLLMLPLLLDEGEVVVLTTHEGGRTYETPLWIVSVDGDSYLRASSPDADWLARVRAEPIVTLHPEGEEDTAAVRRYRATPIDDAGTRRRVNQAMARKYGLSDKVWSRLSHHSASVPIRLVETAGADEHASVPEPGGSNPKTP